jgi:uncharacterized protein (DUF4415 family)
MAEKKRPAFVTKDLGDSPADDAEMMRRWEIYDREMKTLIAAGGVRQDEDGWWVDNATGELIGPDPVIERPLSPDELAKAVPLAVAFPDLAVSSKRDRGRPKTDNAKEAVTLRLSPETVAHFKAIGGSDWRAPMSEALEKTSRAP